MAYGEPFVDGLAPVTGWENYDEDVSRSVININKVREEVMSLTRAYFGELQASIEQDINQPVRREIDAFFLRIQGES